MNKAKKVVATMIGLPAAIYMMSPVDFIPDFIPIAGQADDAAVGVGAIVLLVIAFLVFLLLDKLFSQPKDYFDR